MHFHINILTSERRTVNQEQELQTYIILGCYRKKHCKKSSWLSGIYNLEEQGWTFSMEGFRAEGKHSGDDTPACALTDISPAFLPIFTAWARPPMAATSRTLLLCFRQSLCSYSRHCTYQLHESFQSARSKWIVQKEVGVRKYGFIALYRAAVFAWIDFVKRCIVYRSCLFLHGWRCRFSPTVSKRSDIAY